MEEFAKSIWEEFSPSWDKLINLYSNSNIDADLLQNCCFCVSPNPTNRRQFIFHVLIITEAFVEEALPTEDKVKYKAWHFYWKTDKRIKRNLDTFYKNRESLERAQERIISNAIHEGEFPPFLSPDFWINSEKIILDYHNTPTLSPYTSQGKIFPPEIVTLSSSGKVVRNKNKLNAFLKETPRSPVSFPSSRICVKLCRNFYATLINPTIRHKMLTQISRDSDCPSIPNFAPPSHKGWINKFGIYEYIGLHCLEEELETSTTTEALDLKSKQSIYEYEKLFESVPKRISIPLLAFALFSVMKIFIKSYPSRISKHQSFQSVVEQQRKMIFMSLSGKNAPALAEAFYRAFNKDNTPQRVHDGVIIVNEPPKSFNTFANEIMAQDACVLCINPTFEKNIHEIKISTDVDLSDTDVDYIQTLVSELIYEFIDFLNKAHEYQLNEESEKCFTLLLVKFEQYCKKSAYKLDISPKEVDFYIDKLKCTLPKVHYTWDSLDELYSSMQKSQKKMFKNWESSTYYRIKEDHEKKNMDDFLKYAKREISMCKRKFADDFVYTRTAKIAFSHTDKKHCPQKYAHLYSAMLTFCSFLKYNGIPDKEINLLKQESFEVLYNLMLNREEKSVPSLFLNEYLSFLIKKGKIIPFRTKAKKDTCGWYDAKKQYIYLPYASYFATLSEYWHANNPTNFPYKKAELQNKLIDLDILIARKNGPNSSYIRPEHRMTVSPAKDKIQLKEAVLKVDLKKLSLDKEAERILKEISDISVCRRSYKKETKKAITTADKLSVEENVERK